MVKVNSDKHLYIGIVTSPHGIKGNVKIKTFTTHPSDLSSFQEIYDQDGKIHSISVLSTKKDFIIASFSGIKTRTQAEEIAGLKLYINRDSLPKTDDDEYYHADLIGLQARNPNGHVVGIVENVDNFGASDLLDIRRNNSNKLFYYPFSKNFVTEVNLEEKFIVLEELEEIIAEPLTETKEERCFIVTIDGPSAAGKGTIAKKLATELEFDYLDTGLMYRLLSYNAKEKDIAITDLQGLMHLAKNTDYTNVPSDIESQCRTEEIGNIASNISQIPQIRAILNELQRLFPLNKKGVVIDGRDIGSVIFPDAECKLYITASPEVRTQRRYSQIQKSNSSYTDINSIKEDLRKRDERDKVRTISPLLISKDATVIDTSSISIEEACSVAKHKVLSSMSKQ